MFDRSRCIVGLLVLQVRTLGNPVGTVGQRGNPGRNLGGGIADLADQLLEVAHHFVEYLGRLTDLVPSLDRQATGQVAFAAGDVAQAAAQVVERYGDEMVGQEVDDQQQCAEGAEGGAGNLQAEAGDFGLNRVERDLHADQTENGAFRSLVANDAVLAEVVGRGVGRVDHAQEGTAALVFDGDVRLAFAHHLLLLRVEFAVALGVRTVQLDHGFAAGNVQVLDDRQLLDLVEEDLALIDGAGDHHAGEAGHGHFVNALREILGLVDRGIAIDVGHPDDGSGPDQCEDNPDGSSQANPDFQVGKARHFYQPLL